MKLFRFTLAMILAVILIMTAVLLSLPTMGGSGASSDTGSGASSDTEPDELAAAWVSFLELTDLFKGADEANFRTKFEEYALKAELFGLNALIVQVRPYADALYPSDVYPWSHIITGTQGKDPGYDPLKVMVEVCHQHHLEIHAWVNPYRVKGKNNLQLSADNTALKWYNDKDSDAVLSVDGGLYLNPGNEQAKQLVLDGISELVSKYDVDGIHMDDYFYPSADTGYDAETFTAYTAAGGKGDLSAFRRTNVDDLVGRIYRLIKEVKPAVQFGISPGGNIEKNYNEQFADVARWLSTEGYVDYVMPQIYFGFEHGTLPFDSTADKWAEMKTAPGVKLYAGLPAYKIGTRDSYAGTGENEWMTATENLKTMVLHLRSKKEYSGFAIYSFTSLFYPDEAVKARVLVERNELSKLLK